MPEIIVNAAQALHQLLASEGIAAAVRATVVGGADGVFETGDVTPDILTAQQAKRTEGGDTALSLCLSVQDAGEVATDVDWITQQHVSIRALDREQGYHNIRNTLNEVRKLLRRYPLLTITGAGVLQVRFLRSVGHVHDRDWRVEFGALTYAVRVEHDLGG